MSIACHSSLALWTVTSQTAPVGLSYGRRQIGRPVCGQVLVRVMAYGACELLGQHLSVDTGPDFVHDPPEMVGFTAPRVADRAISGLLPFGGGMRKILVPGRVTCPTSKRTDLIT